MEDVIMDLIKQLTTTRTIFIISTTMIVADVLSGFIKTFKNKNYSSSINRDGLAKKMMWFLMLLLGVAVDYILHYNAITVVVGASCVFCEFMSIIENARDVGIEFKITQYLEKSDKDVG